jgi:hypothetical protein
MTGFSEKQLHKIGRIDQVIRDWFAVHADETEVQAKSLMPLFFEKGIFLTNNRDGLPIRSLLRQLDKEGKLHLLKHAHVVRNAVNRNWYFVGRKEVNSEILHPPPKRPADILNRKIAFFN